MEAEALFNQIDEDQSGELSLPELQSHLADLGFTDVDAEQLLFDLDTDKNGQVLVAMATRKHCACVVVRRNH
jgi:Ca2+-binding EF-hand superfamily protein